MLYANPISTDSNLVVQQQFDSTCKAYTNPLYYFSGFHIIDIFYILYDLNLLYCIMLPSTDSNMFNLTCTNYCCSKPPIHIAIGVAAVVATGGHTNSEGRASRSSHVLGVWRCFFSENVSSCTAKMEILSYTSLIPVLIFRVWKTQMTLFGCQISSKYLSNRSFILCHTTEAALGICCSDDWNN